MESPRLKDLEDDRKISLYENLPTYEAILAFDLSQVHRDLSLIPQDFEISPHSTQIRTVGTAEEKEPNASFAKEDSVKELIVDQGALMALSNSLTDSKNEGDLILVSLDTLQQLLYGNKKLREEFKYTSLFF